jgi:hypothetical protein
MTSPVSLRRVRKLTRKLSKKLPLLEIFGKDSIKLKLPSFLG